MELKVEGKKEFINIFKNKIGMGLLAVMLSVIGFSLNRFVEAGVIYLLVLNLALSLAGAYTARVLFGILIFGRALKENLHDHVFSNPALAGILTGSVILGNLAAVYLRGYLYAGLPLYLVSVWFVTGLVYYAFCFAGVKISAGDPGSK